jgi:dTDP-4-dehydrorhamnose reductase
VNVVVTGAAGQLGTETATAWTTAGHIVTALKRADLDLTKAADIHRAMDRLRPDLVINCSADNGVDAAESNALPPLAVNAWAVAALARASAELGATFIHYSTDFVFDGTSNRPYREDDGPNPKSVYGMTKLLGEMLAADAPRHYVLRVESLFGGEVRHSSIDRLWDRMAAGQPAMAFADRTISPSFVRDITWATRTLVESHAPTGLYHCVNTGHASFFDVADHLRALGGFSTDLLTAGRVAEASLPAPRPMFTALSNQKLRDIGIPMPDWRDAISRYVTDRRA